MVIRRTVEDQVLCSRILTNENVSEARVLRWDKGQCVGGSECHRLCLALFRTDTVYE